MTEGFTLHQSGGAVGPITNDFGRQSWTVVSGGSPVSYSQSLSPSQQTNLSGADWVLSATLRIIQSPNIYLAFYAGDHQYALGFDMDPNGDPIVNSKSSLNPVFVLSGGGPGYHDYQLGYHATTSMASLWVDGIERVNDITGIPGFSGWTVFWGAVQGPASEANWNLVDFGIAPEPSSASLVIVGVMALRFARRRPPEEGQGSWVERFRNRLQ